MTHMLQIYLASSLSLLSLNKLAAFHCFQVSLRSSLKYSCQPGKALSQTGNTNKLWRTDWRPLAQRLLQKCDLWGIKMDHGWWKTAIPIRSVACYLKKLLNDRTKSIFFSTLNKKGALINFNKINIVLLKSNFSTW